MEEKETEIFYHRIRGDVYKYLSQVSDNGKYLLTRAEECFRESLEKADFNLEDLHPLRLFSALSLAIFYNKYAGRQDHAMTILINVRTSKKAIKYYEATLEENLENQCKDILDDIYKMVE